MSNYSSLWQREGECTLSGRERGLHHWNSIGCQKIQTGTLNSNRVFCLWKNNFVTSINTCAKKLCFSLRAICWWFKSLSYLMIHNSFDVASQGCYRSYLQLILTHWKSISICQFYVFAENKPGTIFREDPDIANLNTCFNHVLYIGRNRSFNKTD